MTTVKTANEKHTLLEILTGLYERISQALLHKRLNNYHSCLSDNIDEDVIESLSQVLDKLTAAEIVNRESTRIHTSYLSLKRLSSNGEDELQLRNTQPLSKLSDYFKNNNGLFDRHPSVSDKLMLSIMDNIHASIRLARQGNCETSKLHMGIASSAIAELQHFLTTEEFHKFTNEIKHIITLVACFDYPASSDNNDNNE